MNLLILGGTVFVGRHIVESALERGHRVTLFHRGQRGSELFGDSVERVLGDRDGGLSALDGGRWDAVVDTSGYVPRIVRQSVEFAQSRSPQYLFISTISVYEVAGSTTLNENSHVKRLEDLSTEVVDGDTYGGLKVLCEQEVERGYGDGATIIRPTIIAGPHDPTDRFTYWPLRFHRGGNVAVPDRLDQPVQLIDVRDLAKFCIKAIEDGTHGTFNAAGPARNIDLGEMLNRVRLAVNPSASMKPVPHASLEEAGVKPWGDLPLYLGADPSDDAMLRADISRAALAGLTLRPLEDTARDTLAWALTERSADLKAGLNPTKESELLGTLTAST